MRIGAFADVHDHVDNIRHAVSYFNQASCELVVFAGDLVSPLVVPPLRKLSCPLVSVFGDSDGDRPEIERQMQAVGGIFGGPIGCLTRDGTRLLITHRLESVRGLQDQSEVIIYGHTHRPLVARDRSGRLLVNPGETGGWASRTPTVALIETADMSANIISLPEMSDPPLVFE